MNDSSNSVLDTANTNFSQAPALNDDCDAWGRIFLGLEQVANAVANQVGDSSSQGVAQVASANFDRAWNLLDNSCRPGRSSLQALALGLSQLATAMKALS
jgi:hypothetical protein